MKKVYSTKEYYTPGFPKHDPDGFYTELSDDDFNDLLKSGVVFEEKDGKYYTNAAALNRETKQSVDSALESKGLFANPGKSIKGLSTVLFIIGCVISLITGISAGSVVDVFGGGFNFWTFLLTTAIGVFVSYVSCLVIAAIGDIALNIRDINKKT